jgi:hypothetical protein
MASIQIRIPDWLDRICVWPVMVHRRRKYGYSFRRIYLDEGLWTIVDPQDYYHFGRFKWYLDGHDGKFYAVMATRVGLYDIKRVRLHREIMSAPAGLLVDHRNGDSLDNRRDNLRLATHSQNSCNKRKRKNALSRFIGVSFIKRENKWASQIRHEGKKMWLGCFDNEIDAAKAHDAAAIKYHGEFARLNFPEEAAES